MKRGIILLLLALAITALVITSCSQEPLSETELQKRAEDYALLVEALQSVGYTDGFRLRESRSMEDNLRRLWSREDSFADPRKNMELLILLGNFDFMAEGLQSRASKNNTSLREARFSDEEVLWLMLLLPDADLPEIHDGLPDVLAECGAAVLSSGNHCIWVYFEKTSPGLLERVHSSFYFGHNVPAGMAEVFRNASHDVQHQFMQTIDVEKVRQNLFRPTSILTYTEAQELLRDFPPTDPWEGGYIRVKDDEEKRWLSPREYENKSDVLVAVTSPANARFVVYEDYTQREFYATYVWDNSDRCLDVYLVVLHVRIVDLVTGEEILNESVPSDIPPDEISFASYYGIGLPRDGKHYRYDFTYDRYAAVMEVHLK